MSIRFELQMNTTMSITAVQEILKVGLEIINKSEDLSEEESNLRKSYLKWAQTLSSSALAISQSNNFLLVMLAELGEGELVVTKK